MSDFLRQLGYSPLVYWFSSGIFLALLLAAAFASTDPARRFRRHLDSPAVFGGLLLLAMLAWRWPAIFHFKPVNPDEPQFLAGAITMLARGNLWWTDPTTSGPLVVFPLTLPGLFGLPIDFATGRLIALLLTWGQVFFAYLTLRHVHGNRWARMLVLPLACLMVFLLFWDFTAYCSELAPVCLCALAVWLGVTAFSADGRAVSRRRLAGSGLILGILPFSKFQVLPLGAAIGFALSCWALFQPGTGRGKNVRDMLCLWAGTGAALGLLLLSLGWSGLGADVYRSYVVHNLDYAQARALGWGSSGYVLSYLTNLSWGFAAFHWGALLLLLISLLGLRHAGWRLPLLAWLLLLTAYFAVLTPGRLYPHYLLFLPLPLALLVGLQFGWLLKSTETQPYGRTLLWVSLFVGVGVLPQLVDRIWDKASLQKLIPPASPRTNVVRFINQVKRPGDRLAVWGWRPELYVETQLPQATREGHTNAQLLDSPLRDYYRARFVADLRASRPAFFIDSVGPDDFGHHDLRQDGHETLPALADYVRQEYVPLKQTGAIRVYVRRDLATQ
jgi:hypothetical protein